MRHLLLTLDPDALPEGVAMRLQPSRESVPVLGPFLAARLEGVVYAWMDVCPHWQVPLSMPDSLFLSVRTPVLTCQLHRARFDVRTGSCVSGPCFGDSLQPVPVVAALGRIFFFLPRDLRKC